MGVEKVMRQVPIPAINTRFMDIIPQILINEFRDLRTECSHIEDNFFMKFSKRGGKKIASKLY